jgi:ABC-type dipeptide transport system, periplasmic component
MDVNKRKSIPIFAQVKKLFTDLLFFVKKIFSGKPKNISAVDLDKKLVYSLSKSKIPKFSQLKYLGKTLTKEESRLINFFIFIIIINLGWLGFNAAQQHLKVVPTSGGQYVEAVIGNPAHINPLYSSLSEADSDISRLVYSSLFKYDGNGSLVGDLAESYSVSTDGKTYTIKIRGDARWQNGDKLTADDVVFTFNDLTNPAFNSPLRASFAGVDANKQDDQTVVFTLSESYAPFLGLLTFGILPQSVWGQIDPASGPIAVANLKPVGSGPYQFKVLSKDNAGDIKTYTLTANKNYYGKKPFIKDIIFKFYGSVQEAVSALNDNSIDGLGNLTPSDRGNLIAKNSLNFNQLALPRLKAVFFNQSKNPLLKDVKVRQALSFATPKQQIIDQAENGNAKISDGPIPDNSYAFNSNIEKYGFDTNHAASLLASAGWKKFTISADNFADIKAKSASSTTVLNNDEKHELILGSGTWLYQEQAPAKTTKTTTKTKTPAPVVLNYLIINLTIIDDDENNQIANIIKSSWEKLGVKVIINPIAISNIQNSTVKPKNYEALLFTEQIGNDPDVYVFWDSTQAIVGGLNLANYKNQDVDKILEDGRTNTDQQKRLADYQQFQTLIANDAPAVFLFSPNYTYVQNKKLKGFTAKSIAVPADRFADISDWYVKTGEKLEW